MLFIFASCAETLDSPCELRIFIPQLSYYSFTGNGFADWADGIKPKPLLFVQLYVHDVTMKQPLSLDVLAT